MSDFYIDPRSDIVLVTVFAADFLIYWVFWQIGRMANTVRNQEVIAPRLLACLGVGIVTALFIWYTRANLIDPAIYDAMTPREQGEYLGGLLRTAVFPALIIIGISAARAWRDAQERKYRGKNT